MVVSRDKLYTIVHQEIVPGVAPTWRKNMALFDRAAHAHENGGVEAYWETLSTPPLEATEKRSCARTGTGYIDPDGGGHDNHQGTGHASDPIPPVDKAIERW